MSTTGYGPRRTLVFDGDEQKYELWQVKFLGNLRLQKRYDVVTNCEKSESTNNVISSCGDGNDSGANETGRNEKRSGSNAHRTSGSETKRKETNNSAVGDSKKKMCSSDNKDKDLTSYAAVTKGKARAANKRSAVIIGDSMITNING